MRRGHLLAAAIAAALVSGSPAASVASRTDGGQGTGVGAATKVWRKLPVRAYLERTEPLKVEYVVEQLAKALPYDPDRCLAQGMAAWPRQQNAYAYEITARPLSDTGVGPLTGRVGDDAPHYEFDSNGYARATSGGKPEVFTFAPAPSRFVTGLGVLTWTAEQARLPLNAFSSGKGCGHAAANLEPWRAEGVARLSVPVVTFRGGPKSGGGPKKVSKPPRKAILRVAEVKGELYRVRPDGKRKRLRHLDWVAPGDVLVTSPGTYAVVEAVTGGRIGFAADRAILVLDDGNVEDITDDGVLEKARVKSLRVWRKMSTRKEPLEIEAAGGVFGIKG